MFLRNLRRTFNVKPNTILFKSIIKQKKLQFLATISLTLFFAKKFSAKETKEEQKKIEPGVIKKNLPYYTSEEIKKHNNKEDRIWVTFKDGVYDITDFVAIHPGGEKILLAAGGAIDPFWQMYAIHKKEEIFEILEGYRIGNFKKDKNFKEVKTDDPYANEPDRLPIFQINSQKPFNAEPPLEFLSQSFITPNEIFFVRNHLPVPVVDPKTYVLYVEAEGVKKQIKLTLDDLKKFKEHKIVTTIQCAGNRRSEMNEVKRVKGLNWTGGAIGNAEWTGVYLRDILKELGLEYGKEGNLEHVHFEGYDMDMEKNSYGSSIPISKALDLNGDVLVAYKMNGVDIPRDHGYPVRVIVPGIVGARNVKWLKKIRAAKDESSSFWQKKDYKGFSPSVDYADANYEAADSIQDLPVQSQICIPKENDVVLTSDEKILVKGYSWSGNGRGISWVDVSADGGKTWKVAKLTAPMKQKYGRTWAWAPWEIELDIPKDKTELKIVAKAVDTSFNTQPEEFAPIWNIRGVLSNAWPKVHVKIQNDEDDDDEE
eukprot:gene3201-5517_t